MENNRWHTVDIVLNDEELALYEQCSGISRIFREAWGDWRIWNAEGTHYFANGHYDARERGARQGYGKTLKEALEDYIKDTNG